MNHKIPVFKISKYFPLFLLSLVVLQGCSGTHTYANKVLAGETAVVGAGWKHHFTQDNITVTFTPNNGDTPIVYLPGNPAIKGIINLYPDPLSSLVVSEQLNQNITDESLTYSSFVKTFTDGGNEWWQTTVYLDTPTNLPVGNTVISITTPEGETATSDITVVGAGGTPDVFSGEGSGNLIRKMFEAMERLDHYVVEFTGSTVPAAIQVDLSSTLLTAVVKGKRGDISTLNWNKDGSGNYRVIITPASQGSITSLSDFSFYIPIGGGVEGLTTLSFAGAGAEEAIQAFDETGAPIPITEVTASISLVKGVGGLSVIQ